MEITFATDTEIKDRCNQFDLTEDMQNHLESFLSARRKFHSNENIDNLTIMKHYYEIVYTDLKLAYHMKIMTEEDFFSLIDLIQYY